MVRKIVLAVAVTALGATPALAGDGHHRSNHQRYYNYWYQPYTYNWNSPFGYTTSQRYWRYRSGYWGDYRRHGDWDDDERHWRSSGDHDGHHWRGHDNDQGEDNDDQGENEDD